jgi:DNA-binding NarL/FixJ family response regulator
MSPAAIRDADPTATAPPVLVCATTPAGEEPLVVLAGDSYETATERVFLDTGSGEEVLRLPLSVPVAVRPVRRFAPIPAQAVGEQALVRAVVEARRSDGPEPATAAASELARALTAALRAGDAVTSTHLAAVLESRAGTPAVYRAMTGCLAGLGQEWAQGYGTVLAERAATHAAQSVCDRLRERAAAPTRIGTVVLAVPPGERHTLALAALAHLLQSAGWPVLVVDDLPTEELAELAARPGTLAVVLSAHVTLSTASARRLLSGLREAAPDVLLAAGGAGFPRTTPFGADLVTEDPGELLRELGARSSALTTREHEVLLAVADGLTNAEIAEKLRVSPSTVKTHLDHVFTKTRTEHRAAAVARALRQGWIR